MYYILKFFYVHFFTESWFNVRLFSKGDFFCFFTNFVFPERSEDYEILIVKFFICPLPCPVAKTGGKSFVLFDLLRKKYRIMHDGEGRGQAVHLYPRLKDQISKKQEFTCPRQSFLVIGF